MKRWTLLTALPLAASIAFSCLVYDPSDLRGLGGGNGQSGGSSGRGGMASGGASGGNATPGGQTGEGGTGGPPVGAGSSGSSSGGSAGSAPDGRAGEGGRGEGGEGGTPSVPAGGSAGSPSTAGTGPVVDTSTLIDDLEDGEHRIKAVKDPSGVTRNGSWYTYTTGKAAELLPAMTPFIAESHPEAMPGPEPPNVYAFRLFVRQVALGSGNGAAGGFNFREPKGVYDGSRYVGISYWARASKSVAVRTQIVIKGTDSELGDCTTCSDHYFKEVTVGTTWTKLEGHWGVPNDFGQEGWGDEVPFNPAELVAVQFFVAAAATSPQIELWIDNITFVEP